MIAGSNTPFILMLMEGSLQVFFLVLFWSMVLVGTLYKMYFLNKYPWFSLCFYLALGWLGVITAYFVYDQLTTNTLLLLLAGGVAYTIGTYYYNNDNIRYNHTIWHLFVMAGTLFHLFAVLTIL